MADTEALKTIVSELMKVPAESLDASTVLGGVLSSSLGRARLDAALRSRLSFTDPAVYTVKTFGELCRVAGAVVSGAASPAVAIGTKSVFPLAGSVGAATAIGVDIQSIANLPETADYWETDFYKQHFTRQEIAYALLQSHPHESFAAAWCAKEALKKADNRWIGFDWQQIELTHDDAGKPRLVAGGSPIPCSVSLSHTDGIAVAVVAMHSPQAASQDTRPVMASSPNIPVPAASPAPSKTPLILSALAFLASLAATYVALHR